MEPRQVKIFAPKDVPRLRYIAGLILGDILGLQWDVVTDKRKIGKYPVINYSNEVIKGSFSIIPHSLLFDTTITQYDVSLSSWNGLPLLFRVSGESDLPFDIFAASFYMVSRYEEYIDHQTDEHSRFSSFSSLAGRNGFIDRPVVELWTREFAKALLKKHPMLAFKRNEFRAMLTIDIDEPFAYLGKSLLKSFGGLLRDLAVKEGHAADRYKVMKHEMQDPFGVYDYIFEKIDENNAKVNFFLPTGDQSKYDHSPSWKNEEYRELFKKITGRYQTGIHPSYYASGDLTLLKKESDRFEEITGEAPSTSRFHFLRLSFPSSYKNLLKCGIREDYSMGFHDEPGFRAGIARPFYFYDLYEEKQTDLRIIPFMVMDATLIKYMKLDAVSSEEMIFRIIDQTRQVGGQFVSIWHNTTLLENTEGTLWRKLFEETLKYQQS